MRASAVSDRGPAGSGQRPPGAVAGAGPRLESPPPGAPSTPQASIHDDVPTLFWPRERVTPVTRLCVAYGAVSVTPSGRPLVHVSEVIPVSRNGWTPAPSRPDPPIGLVGGRPWGAARDEAPSRTGGWRTDGDSGAGDGRPRDPEPAGGDFRPLFRACWGPNGPNGAARPEPPSHPPADLPWRLVLYDPEASGALRAAEEAVEGRGVPGAGRTGGALARALARLTSRLAGLAVLAWLGPCSRVLASASLPSRVARGARWYAGGRPAGLKLHEPTCALLGAAIEAGARAAARQLPTGPALHVLLALAALAALVLGPAAGLAAASLAARALLLPLTLPSAAARSLASAHARALLRIWASLIGTRELPSLGPKLTSVLAAWASRPTRPELSQLHRAPAPSPHPVAPTRRVLSSVLLLLPLAIVLPTVGLAALALGVPEAVGRGGAWTLARASARARAWLGRPAGIELAPAGFELAPAARGAIPEAVAPAPPTQLASPGSPPPVPAEGSPPAPPAHPTPAPPSLNRPAWDRDRVFRALPNPSPTAESALVHAALALSRLPWPLS